MLEHKSRALDQAAPLTGWELPDCFQILLEYRERVENVLSFSRGILEANGLYQYALIKAGELTRIVRENTGIIDDLLVAFISPESKEFTVDDLARNYSYPDVDLLAIDADWY